VGELHSVMIVSQLVSRLESRICYASPPVLFLSCLSRRCSNSVQLLHGWLGKPLSYLFTSLAKVLRVAIGSPSRSSPRKRPFIRSVHFGKKQEVLPLSHESYRSHVAFARSENGPWWMVTISLGRSLNRSRPTTNRCKSWSQSISYWPDLSEFG